jgi:hypothetical protein
VIGSQVALPEELRVAYDALLLLAVAMFARFVAKEMRPRGTRILVLGSGTMAAGLIEEIEYVLKYGAWVDCGVMGNRRAVDYLSEVQRCMGRMRGNSYPSGNILDSHSKGD